MSGKHGAVGTVAAADLEHPLTPRLLESGEGRDVPLGAVAEVAVPAEEVAPVNVLASLGAMMTGTPARPSARVMFRPPSSITMAMRWASRAYVAGPTLEDAVRVCDRLATQKLATSIGFWNAAGDDPRAVAHAYLVGLETIARSGLDCSVSVKASAMALLAGAHGRSAETRN